MSPFDILPRNLPKHVDAQPVRDQSVANEGGEHAAASSETDSFSSLLQGLAGRSPQNGAKAQSAEDLGQVEATAEVKAKEASGTGVASSVLALLQGILPNFQSQVSSIDPNGNEQERATSSQLLSEGMQLSQDESDLSDSAAAPKLTATVRHQETHFKPIIDQSEARFKTENVDKTGNASDDIQVGELVHKTSSSLEQQASVRDTRTLSSHSHVNQAPAELDLRQGDPSSVHVAKHEIKQASEQVEAYRASAAPTESHDEGAGLPSETLHRIVGAIKTDLHTETSNAPARSMPESGPIRTMSIKASESALRVLNLQLHPAELGMVTIKMRLAGESLEMELLVEREETAQLLRQDSEKLSALLRGSGYRPDAISIHVGDSIIQERIATRAQADPQMQGQSFPQEGSGQGGRPRDQEKSYAHTRAEHQKNLDGDKMLGGPSPGGVYL